jgi:hypothetical protein
LQVKVRAEILEILEQQAMLVVQGIREILVEREQQETQEWEILAIVGEEIQDYLVVLVVEHLEVALAAAAVAAAVVVEIREMQVVMVHLATQLQLLGQGKMVEVVHLQIVEKLLMEMVVMMDLMEILEILEVVDSVENLGLAQEL